MTARTARRAIRIVVSLTVLILALSQGPAVAGPDTPPPPPAPQPEPPGTVGAEPAPAPQAPVPSTPAAAPTAPTTSALDDSPGHTTPAPAGDSHARASAAQVNLAGEELLTLNETNASVDGGGEGHGDVTVLALGGNEIIGVHSDSDGTPSDETGVALACEESGGQVCIGLLYARTQSSRTGDPFFGGSTTSTSDASLVFLCLGGSTTAPGPVCDGPVGFEVAGSHSRFERTPAQPDAGGFSIGESAEAETELLDVCLGGEADDGICQGLGVSVLGAQSQSTANGARGPGTTSQDSWLLAIETQGTRNEIPGDALGIAVPPDCPEAGSLICLFLEQGMEQTGPGQALSRAEALHLDVLKAVGQVPGDTLILAHLGTAETLVRSEVVICSCPPPPPPHGDDVAPRGGGPDVLAFTGSSALALVALALIFGVAGGGVLAWDRRLFPR